MNNDGLTALHFAAARNHADTCAVLLEEGTEKGARTTGLETALDFAVKYNNVAAAAVLVQSCRHTWSGDFFDILHVIQQCSVDMLRLLNSPQLNNNINMRKLFILIREAVEREKTAVLEYLLDEYESLTIVEDLQGLLLQAKNQEIKNLLQKSIDKKLGIVEVKKEEDEETSSSTKKAGKPKKKK